MNHCVPDFDLDEDFNLPHTATSSSGSIRHNKKSVMVEEDIMELLWQNGQVVTHTQNQRSCLKSQFSGYAAIPAEQPVAREIRPAGEEAAANQHVFMEEDEMASWLHYPLEDSSCDLYSDFLYPPASSAPVCAAAAAAVPPQEIRSAAAEIRQAPTHQRLTQRPFIPPAKPPRVQNFGHFSRLPRARIEIGPSSSSKAPIESTVVESNVTPMVGTESRVSHVAESAAPVSGGNVRRGSNTTAPCTGIREEMMTFEQTVTSSPGDSGNSGSAETPQKPAETAPDDRKRKGREADDTEGHSEDIDIESNDSKKQAHGSASTKRSRAAEVHNLSERRRRDRINEKMRALQELVPCCNKSDKASMLDDAIEYLKSLQLQVQMMSMGCGMVPMMYPGIQHYTQAMGMNMGMCMDMGMNRPMVQYPPHLAGSSMPNATAAAQMSPRFPIPLPPDPSRVHTSNELGSMLTPPVAHNSIQQHMPNFADPFQQLFGAHQAQVTLPLNETVEHPINKPNSSKDGGNPGNHQP